MSALDKLPIQHTPSPNFGPRRDVEDPDMIILHYTDLPDAQTALRWMCDPEKQVSAHFLIGKDGSIYQLVAPKMRAWHAGVSEWKGYGDINSRSIGIELDNPGHSHGLEAFPHDQLNSLIALLDSLRQDYAIDDSLILGHSDIAPGRKIDPGPLFPWRWLHEKGHGLWPVSGAPQSKADSLQDILVSIGYQDCEASIEAFQLHYRAHHVTGKPDEDTMALAIGLQACLTDQKRL